MQAASYIEHSSHSEVAAADYKDSSGEKTASTLPPKAFRDVNLADNKQHKVEGVFIRWTGMDHWNTGMEYWLVTQTFL